MDNVIEETDRDRSLVISSLYNTMEHMLNIELDNQVKRTVKLLDDYPVSNDDNSIRRLQIKDQITTIQQTLIALLEIYEAESKQRSDQLVKLDELDSKTKRINEKIYWINNNSKEIDDIKQFNSKLYSIDQKIEDMELKLADMKIQRNSIMKSKLQSESTLQSDLNKFVISLENVKQREEKTVETIMNLHLVPNTFADNISSIAGLKDTFTSNKNIRTDKSSKVVYPSPHVIRELLKTQITEFGITKDKIQTSYDVIYHCLNWLQDIFECVKGVELRLIEVSMNLKDRTLLDGAILDVLTKGEGGLNEILNKIVEPDSHVPDDPIGIYTKGVKKICHVELNTIKSGIEMVSNHSASHSLHQQLGFSLTKEAKVGTSNIHVTAKQL